jgi:hypothetical protein
MKHELFLAADKLINRSDIGLAGPTSDKGLIKNVLLPVYFWAGALAVIIIIVAGFLYVTSNGNPSQVTRAKNAIIAAVVGLVFVLGAFAITMMVLGGVA